MTSHLAAAEHIEETLKKDGEMIISAVGYSMLPLIPPNSSIEIKRCAAIDLKLGDILLVKRGPSFILHRLCEIRRTNGIFFVTKGDNTLRHDAPVEESVVLGKVTAVGSSKLKKQLWHLANQGIIFFLLKIHWRHKHLAQQKWYKDLSKIRAFFVKRKSLIFPLVKKLESLPLALAHGQQKLRGAYHLTRLFILLPKTHIVKFLPNDSPDAAGRLWERVFPELRFEHHESLKHYLFFHFLSDRPICFLAMNKDRCIGLISASERFPSFRDQTVCSLEAIAVDPDFRRKGLGSALLDRLKGECRVRHITQIATCRNKLFFPGLHHEHHEQAVDLLIRNGFENPSFLEEMLLTPEMYKKSLSPNSIEKETGCAETSFGLLQASQRTIFLEFLKQQDPELFGRYAGSDGWFCLDNLQNQGIVYAEQGGKIIGYGRYDRLIDGWGPATPDRISKLTEFTNPSASSTYIFSDFRIAQNMRRRGIGSKLANYYFKQIFCLGGQMIIWEATIPKFFLRFGARKLNSYIALQASFIRS